MRRTPFQDVPDAVSKMLRTPRACAPAAALCVSDAVLNRASNAVNTDSCSGRLVPGMAEEYGARE